jgi:hypothetical protein
MGQILYWIKYYIESNIILNQILYWIKYYTEKKVAYIKFKINNKPVFIVTIFYYSPNDAQVNCLKILKFTLIDLTETCWSFLMSIFM